MSLSVRRISMAALPVLVLVACNREPAPPAETNQATSEIAAPTAPSELIKADGTPVGSVTPEETPNGVSVTIAATGLPVGVHGVHLHAIGKCEGPKFESAGDHWNPAGRKHGRDNPEGSHLGDLANIEIGAGGGGESIFAIGTARMTEGANALADADGTALVIHAKPDDYKTDPSGNSGDRVACAVLSGSK